MKRLHLHLVLLITVTGVLLSCNPIGTPSDGVLPPKGTIIVLSPAVEKVGKRVLCWSLDGGSIYYLRRYRGERAVYQVDLESKYTISITPLENQSDDYFPISVCVDEVNGYVYAGRIQAHEQENADLVRYRLGVGGAPETIIEQDQVQRRSLALSPDGSRIGYWCKDIHDSWYFATLDLHSLVETVWFTTPFDLLPGTFSWYPDGNSIVLSLKGDDTSRRTTLVKTVVRKGWNQETIYENPDRNISYPVFDDDASRFVFVDWKLPFYIICEVDVSSGQLSYVVGTDQARPIYHHHRRNVQYSPYGGLYIAYSKNYPELDDGEAVMIVCWPEE